MAEQVTVLKVDDIDGKPAEATVRFALDGKEYEIDLSKKHNAQIRRIFDPYIKAGRKLKRVGRPAGSKTRAAVKAADMLEAHTEGDLGE